MMTREGDLKILDFGLAKVSRSDMQVERSLDPLTISMSATEAGMIVGTAGYMSPEQTRGKILDKRTDIWAFGVVLYELAVGERPFQGEDVAQILASVVKDTPQLTKAPVRLRRLLASCMEKDPRLRLQDIGDAWRLLEEPPAAESNRTSFLPWLAVAALAIAAFAGWLRPGVRVGDQPAVTLSIVPPPGITLSDIGRNNATPEISPDGSAVLFFAGGSFYVRRLDSLDTKLVAGSENASNPAFWSSDSTAAVYPSSQGQLSKARIPDGAPQVLAPVLGPSRGGSWSDSGTILFSFGATRFGLNSLTGAAQEFKAVELPVPLNEGEIVFPEFLPGGGEEFLFFLKGPLDSDDGTVYLATFRGGKCQNPVSLLRNETPAHYTPAGGGRLLYARNNNIYSQKLNRRTRALEGEAELVSRGVSSAGRADFSVSRNGTLAWRPGVVAHSQVSEFDRQGNVVPTSGPEGQASGLILSPDEKQLLVSVGTGFWLEGVGQTGRVELQKGVDWFGWSPDGSRLIGLRKGALVEMPSSGLGETREIRKLEAALDGRPPNASADGKQFIAQTVDEMLSFPIDGSPEKITPRVVMHGTEQFFGIRLSPHGQWASYESKDSGGGIYVAALDGREARHQIATVGGRAIWRGDGKEILYVNAETLMSVPVENDGILAFGAPRKLFSGLRLPGGINAASIPLAVSHDGSRIFWAQGVKQLQSNVIHVKIGAVK